MAYKIIRLYLLKEIWIEKRRSTGADKVFHSGDF